MVGRIISLRPARHRRRVDVPAGVGVAERVVEAVGVAVVALRVGGSLQHGVGAQEALQPRGVGAAVHVDEGCFAAGAMALYIKRLHCAVAVRVGVPYTRTGYSHAPAMVGDRRLKRAVCGTSRHGAKVGKLCEIKNK